MHTFIEAQIKRLRRFGGADHEDVIKWLHHTEVVFDRVQLQLAKLRGLDIINQIFLIGPHLNVKLLKLFHHRPRFSHLVFLIDIN
jgi:hypothetical protein